jgi:hypothetical protein
MGHPDRGPNPYLLHLLHLSSSSLTSWPEQLLLLQPPLPPLQLLLWPVLPRAWCPGNQQGQPAANETKVGMQVDSECCCLWVIRLGEIST